MQVTLEPVTRLRLALFLPQHSQFGWRLASVTISLVSVGLIALTVAHRLREFELLRRAERFEPWLKGYLSASPQRYSMG